MQTPSGFHCTPPFTDRSWFVFHILITVQLKPCQHPICRSITFTLPAPFPNVCFSSAEPKPESNVTPRLPESFAPDSGFTSDHGGPHTAAGAESNPRRRDGQLPPARTRFPRPAFRSRHGRAGGYRARLRLRRRPRPDALPSSVVP